MKIIDISELDKLMTEDQKKKAQEDFEKYFPPGTPEVMCVSQEEGNGEQYLRLVDLEDFD